MKLKLEEFLKTRKSSPNKRFNCYHHKTTREDLDLWFNLENKRNTRLKYAKEE